MSEAEEPRPRAASKPKSDSPWPTRVLDGSLLVAFLALTFLLGVFPLKDTDFWWHLKAGDSIRETGALPTVDTYTFGAEGKPWIDLHWTYQVLLSWGYRHGGIPLLNIAKCVITCVAVFLLISARRKVWPWEAMLTAWLPALLVLGGRMYVRPETITLLYLCSYLAILFRVDERPRLAYLLPLVQIFWVNVQGLFVLGPIILGIYLVSAAIRRDAFDKKRRGWWNTMIRATALVGLACLVNPYGLVGALYPIQLLGTMGNPVFSKTIGELQSIPDFIAKSGLSSLPLRLHLVVIFVGAFSFILPIVWRISTAAKDALTKESADKAEAPAKGKKKAGKAKGKSKGGATALLSPNIFRVLLYFAFTILSLKATRNSHQFAAVVGAVTAWNFGEWAAAVRARRTARGGENPVLANLWKVVALGAIGSVIGITATGHLYEWMGEGRTIGLGEEPHWFPHEAVKAAGRPGMPNRSICFHNGHAAYYEYVHAPDKKSYADARLEVIGPELYTQYLDIESRIKNNLPGWQGELAKLGLPLVLVDNVHAMEGGLNATMLSARDWKCVWFDPVAAVYVHDSNREAVARDSVDFLARHFDRFAEQEPADPARHLAQAKAYWNAIYNLIPKPGDNTRPNWRETSKPLLAIGLDHARRFRQLSPKEIGGWKYTGLLEYFRDMPPPNAVPRFRLGFDPIQDLSGVKATYHLVKAREINPDDGNTLATLIGLQQGRGLTEAAIATADAFIARPADTPEQRQVRNQVILQRPQLVAALGTPPSTDWKNLNELSQILATLLNQGRAETAADLLEKAYPPETRPWEIVDRIATYRLNLGQAEEARRLWLSAKDAPSPALPLARGAAASYAMGDLDEAQAGYNAAIAADPKLFEAHYGLAVTEYDRADAAAALKAANAAVAAAPDDSARSAAASIAESIRAYVAKPGAVK